MGDWGDFPQEFLLVTGSTEAQAKIRKAAQGLGEEENIP